jgi:hypothetical protein
MSNSLLTPTEVTREALRILHQKCSFIGSINRQYDDRFAKSGAKIGDTLTIRLPNEYSVRTGATLNPVDVSESSTTLQVSTQKGVDMSFSSVDLTMDMDDFSERVLKPAMSVLASNIENDALSMYKDVSKEVSDVGAAVTVADVLNMGKDLYTSLVPEDNLSLLLHPQANVDLVDALKGLFNAQAALGENYKKGQVANNFMGFDKVFQNSLMPIHTTGTDDGTGDHKVGAADQVGASITHGSEGAGTILKGDIVTFAGTNEVHPETKADTGRLKQFTVTADMSATATTIAISPSMVLTGPRQNISAAPTAGGAITKHESDRSTAIGASADYQISLGYHKDAFAFATADLKMPKGVDFSAREVMDGISMRIIQAYDINNDKFPCRLDVLYGYKTLREQLAVRGGFN